MPTIPASPKAVSLPLPCQGLMELSPRAKYNKNEFMKENALNYKHTNYH
jgi:hypothetical protein